VIVISEAAPIPKIRGRMLALVLAPALVLALLFLAVSIGLLVFSWTVRSRHSDFLRHAVPERGVILELQEDSDPESGPAVFPIVRFTPPKGEVVLFRSRMGVPRERYAPGQEIGVLYDPRKPQQAEIDAPDALHLPYAALELFAITFTAMSLVGVAVVVGVYVWVRRAASREQDGPESPARAE
jgi:hypothetical protein